MSFAHPFAAVTQHCDEDTAHERARELLSGDYLNAIIPVYYAVHGVARKPGYDPSKGWRAHQPQILEAIDDLRSANRIRTVSEYYGDPDRWDDEVRRGFEGLRKKHPEMFRCLDDHVHTLNTSTSLPHLNAAYVKITRMVGHNPRPLLPRAKAPPLTLCTKTKT